MNYFIGGSPCAGKSTICNLLAARHGLQTYHCDEHYDAHLERAKPGSILSQFRSMTWQEAFTTRSLETMIHDELEANRELGVFALEDLKAIDSPVIAEGMALMPELLVKLEPRAKAVYLIPTESFQREQYAKREWAQSLLATTDDPKGVFEKWMARDAANARNICDQARAFNFPVLEVDGSLSVIKVLAWTALNLGLQVFFNTDSSSRSSDSGSGKPR
jgi:dephospho-CoA kinase